MSWAGFDPPVYFVDVTDDFGNYLFSLNTPPFGQGTGSISPNPQTVFGLTSDLIAIVTNGQVLAGDSAFSFAADGDPTGLGTYAFINVYDEGGNNIGSNRFIADAVPEPSTWASMAGGLIAMAGIGRALRRKRSN